MKKVKLFDLSVLDRHVLHSLLWPCVSYVNNFISSGNSFIGTVLPPRGKATAPGCARAGLVSARVYS